MRKLLFCSLLVFASIACRAQYSASTSEKAYDGHQLCYGTSCWNPLQSMGLPSGVCRPNTLITSHTNATTYCVGNDGQVYHYQIQQDVPSQSANSWTPVTAFGGGIYQLAIEDAISTTYPVVYSLQGDCGNGNHYIYKFNWSSSTWSQISIGGCLSQFFAGSQGALSGVSSGSSGWLGNELAGTGWQWLGYFSFLTYSSATDGCAVSGGTLYVQNTNTTKWIGAHSLSSAFPGGYGISAIGCGFQVVSYPQGLPQLFVWDASGNVRTYDFQVSAWKTVAGQALGIVVQPMSTLGLSPAGVPLNFNFAGVFVDATVSGVQNSCPPLSSCPTGRYHTAYSLVTLQQSNWAAGTLSLPGKGTNGQQGIGSGLPSQYISAYSWNANFGNGPKSCDIFFGNPFRAGCSGVGNGSVICGATGSNLLPGEPSWLNCFDYVIYARPFEWPYATAVDVYIDTSSYPQGSSSYTDICSVFTGNVQTGEIGWHALDQISYTCHPSSGAPYPEPAGNYTFVQQMPVTGNENWKGDNEACGPPVWDPRYGKNTSNWGHYALPPARCPVAGTTLTRAWIYVPWGAMSDRQIMASAAHEAGHSDGLANYCDPRGLTGLSAWFGGCAPPGYSVMEPAVLDSSHPTYFTRCDSIWYLLHNIWEAILHP